MLANPHNLSVIPALGILNANYFAVFELNISLKVLQIFPLFYINDILVFVIKVERAANVIALFVPRNVLNDAPKLAETKAVTTAIVIAI